MVDCEFVEDRELTPWTNHMDDDDRLRTKLLAVQKERGENMSDFAGAIFAGEAFRQALRNFLIGRSREGETELRPAGLGKYRGVVLQWLLTHYNFTATPSLKEKLDALSARIVRRTIVSEPMKRETLAEARARNLREEFAHKLSTGEFYFIEISRGRILAGTEFGDVHYPARGVVNHEDYEEFSLVLNEDQRAEFLEYLDIKT